MNIELLHSVAERLFSKSSGWLSLLQEIADHFYPERADFTSSRSLGTEFAAHSETSYPFLARRDLGNSFSSMLRPTNKEWFHMVRNRDDQKDLEGDHEARKWLEWATGVQRRGMYDRASQFTRATKEGDHDFAAFGQTVISVEVNRMMDGMLYRCWHLRDVRWSENTEGKIGAVFRKWKPSLLELKQLFANVHINVQTKFSQDPFAEVDVIHMVVETEMCDPDIRTDGGNKSLWDKNMPYISIYYDVTNKHVMEAVPQPDHIYVIPRWQTVSGSQYAHSPATIVALPDARCIQAITRTLLEAGEKMTNPPMVAVQEAIRSDVSIYAGGITWVDPEYDERLGEVLRPITQDKSGMPLGLEMQQDVRNMIAEAFYLNKLSLPMPENGREMTAYEVGQRVQEYIRHALPLFEPMEMDYNGGLCELTFSKMLRHGAFGDPRAIPRSLRGVDVQFRFESPLHDAVEKQKTQKFLESSQLLANAAQIDKTVLSLMDFKKAARAAILGNQTPAEWLRSEQEVQDVEEQQAEMDTQVQQLAAAQAGSEVLKNVAQAEGATQ